MGKLTLVIIFSVFFFSFYKLCDKIYFIETSLTYAVHKAEKEDKLVFMFLFDPGEQKADFFQSAIFYKPEICSFFNQAFINLKVKTDSDIGQQLITQHQITSTPCFLFFNKASPCTKAKNSPNESQRRWFSSSNC